MINLWRKIKEIALFDKHNLYYIFSSIKSAVKYTFFNRPGLGNRFIFLTGLMNVVETKVDTCGTF